MADPAQEPDIGQLVLDAPDDVWQKIKKTLKVGTRQEAAVMAQSDARAQQAVLQILQGSQQKDTLLTSRKPETFLTQERPTGTGARPGIG